MRGDPFAPDGFEPPRTLAVAELQLVPLGPEHNESDHAVWTSSVAHIRATPGFETLSWPPADGMALAENLDDMERHARDFEERTGFTYTVLAPGSEQVIGCVYIYPAEDDEHDAQVRSWVRADRAELDRGLHAAVALARGTLAVRAAAVRPAARLTARTPRADSAGRRRHVAACGLHERSLLRSVHLSSAGNGRPAARSASAFAALRASRWPRSGERNGRWSGAALRSTLTLAFAWQCRRVERSRRRSPRSSQASA